MHFPNAPIAELIAELRWGDQVSPRITSGSNGAVSFQFGLQSVTADQEQFYSAIRDALADAGYTQSERLVQPGAFVPAGVPIYRFRESGNTPYLVQMGSNTLSIHAVPPYEDWAKFAPIVRKVLDVVQQVRSDDAPPFNVAVLRYINYFGPRFLSDFSPTAFAREKLGFVAALPPRISSLGSGGVNNQSLQVSFDTPAGQRVQLVVAEGQSPEGTVLVVDSSVGTYGNIASDTDAIFAVFNSAHDVTREAFLGMTEQIQDLLGEPTE